MEFYAFNAFKTSDWVTSQHFQGKDNGLLQTLGLALEVEHMNCGIIAGWGHQRVLSVKVNSSDTFFMEGHRLVRFVSNIEIKTVQLNIQKNTFELSPPTIMKES